MSIRVLFFGATAEITGERALTFDPPGSATSGNVFESVLARYPSLSSHRLLYSVNQTYASGEESVADGDELAIFTAVSGG